jgi:hypothetical protein
MPRPRYQLAEDDMPVVHRWVQAKFRDPVWPQPEAARRARDRFLHEPSTPIRLQQWCDRYLDVTQWTQLQAVIRAARRATGQTRTVRLSTRAHARLHDLAKRAQLTLSDTIEKYLADGTVIQTPEDPLYSTEKTPPKPAASRITMRDAGRSALVLHKQRAAFVTSRKGVCYLTIKIGRHNFWLCRKFW